MNAINPYQASGSSPGKLPCEIKAKIGLSSFLVWQFLAFVATEFVLSTVVTFAKCWEDAASPLWAMPITFLLIAVAIIGIPAWLPLALYTFFNSKVRSGGAVLNKTKVSGTVFERCQEPFLCFLGLPWGSENAFQAKTGDNIR